MNPPSSWYLGHHVLCNNMTQRVEDTNHGQCTSLLTLLCIRVYFLCHILWPEAVLCLVTFMCMQLLHVLQCIAQAHPTVSYISHQGLQC